MNLYGRLLAATLVVSGLVLGSAANAQYAALPAPGAVAPVPTVPQMTTAPVATLLNQAFSNSIDPDGGGPLGTNTLSGTISSAVYAPGDGFRYFLYQITLAAPNNVIATGANFASFAGFTTGVGQAQDGDTGAIFSSGAGTTAASSAIRDAAGEGIQFNFTATTGQTTFTYMVQTTASNQVTGSVGLIAAGIGATGLVLAPTTPTQNVAPEPASLALIGMTLLGGVAVRRRKKA